MQLQRRPLRRLAALGGERRVRDRLLHSRATSAFYGHAAPYWTTFDRYFSAILAETYPNRFYQHSAQTDRIHNSTDIATMPTIWDRLAGKGVSHAYYYVDMPFLALSGTQVPRHRAHAGRSSWPTPRPATLPAVSFVDPKFLDEGTGTSADDHPHADIRAGQAFLNQVYEAVTGGPGVGADRAGRQLRRVGRLLRPRAARRSRRTPPRRPAPGCAASARRR